MGASTSSSDEDPSRSAIGGRFAEQLGAGPAGVQAVEPRREGLVEAGADVAPPPRQLLDGEGMRPDVGQGEDGLAQVLAGHGQHQVGALQELPVDDPAAMGRQVDSPLGQHVHPVGAGRLADQAETGGADVHVDPPPFESVSQERLGHGRAADVAGAQEEDLDGPTLGAWRRLITLPRRWPSTPGRR